jgi:hypothetical protein
MCYTDVNNFRLSPVPLHAFRKRDYAIKNNVYQTGQDQRNGIGLDSYLYVNKAFAKMVSHFYTPLCRREAIWYKVVRMSVRTSIRLSVGLSAYPGRLGKIHYRTEFMSYRIIRIDKLDRHKETTSPMFFQCHRSKFKVVSVLSRKTLYAEYGPNCKLQDHTTWYTRSPS